MYVVQSIDQFLGNKYIIGLPKIILLPIVIGIIARIIYAIFFTDLTIDYYWEYGELAKNILNGKGYSLFYWSNGSLQHLADGTNNPLPSAYMPPLYSILLIPFILIKEVLIRNVLLLLSHIAIQVITTKYVYKITDKYFSTKVGLTAVWIFCLLPEFIYSTSTWGVTTLFHLQIILLVYFLSVKEFETNKQKVLYISLLFISMIYLRAEALGLAFVFLAYIFIKDNKKTALSIAFILVVSWVPWVLRNYIVFERIIITTTNSGLNFHRGNNEYYPGSWGGKKILSKRQSLSRYKDFEVRMSEYHFDQALKSIENNSARTIYNIGSKFFHFWVFFSRDERTDNVFYYVPWFVLLSTGLIGLYRSSGKLKKIMLLYLIYTTVIVMIFFALPRYQTMMKITLVPFAANTIYEWICSFRTKS